MIKMSGFYDLFGGQLIVDNNGERQTYDFKRGEIHIWIPENNPITIMDRGRMSGLRNNWDATECVVHFDSERFKQILTKFAVVQTQLTLTFVYNDEVRFKTKQKFEFTKCTVDLASSIMRSKCLRPRKLTE